MDDMQLYLCKGLYNNSSRVTPVVVAKTERIQKLSWQKLQYWMMARMVAQHKNMVTWKESNRELMFVATGTKKIPIDKVSYSLIKVYYLCILM